MFRRIGSGEATAIEVLLAHPGGPYWESRHEGAWSIPKGGRDPHETSLEAAIREFREETSFEPAGPYHALGRITQRSGKVVYAWAFEGDCDITCARSINTHTEWPPRSGTFIEIPEVDRVEFFSIDAARVVINSGQARLLDRLLDLLSR
jgi:predicted NUDIX family NTP pyrophosphohydrolase